MQRRRGRLAPPSLSFYSVPGLLPRGSSPRHVKLPTTVSDTRATDFSTGRDISLKTYPPEIAVHSLENLTYFRDESRVEEVETFQ